MMSDLAAHLLAAAFPGATGQPSNLLSAAGGGGGPGGGGGGGGPGMVGVIGSGGGSSYGQQQQQPFDGGGGGLGQQQGGGGSPYSAAGGGGRITAVAGGEKLDLSDYRRLARPKPEPANESEIIVSSSGNIRPYVESGTEVLTLGPRVLPAEGGGADAGGEEQGGAGAAETIQRKAPLARIYIKGTGQAMANAILVAEGVRRAVPNLHMIVQTHAEEVLDDWVLTPAAEEERRIAESQQREDLLPLTVKVPRTVYQLVLVLAKHVTNEELQDVGYQAPLAPGYSSSADFLQDAEKRGFGGRRGGRGGRRGRGRGGYEWGRGWRGGYRGGRGRGRRGRGGGDFPADQLAGGAKREDIADY